jgi:hypothetical protein
VYPVHTDIREPDMRRLLAIALPALLLLGVASPASAKGIVGAKVCGADGCRTLATADQSLLEGGPPTAGPAAREPFVRLDVTVGGPGHHEPVRLVYLPRSELLLADDGETWMQPLGLAELRAIAERVRPFPAKALPASAPLAASVPLAASAPSDPPSSAGGVEAWWLVASAAAVALLAGALRRRRRGPSARAAGAAH